ncbi:hypothetical protein CLG85_021180 [Yangia mangrovi]|uniref:Uncharacterized protein n=1 Tax=Alloyangia mangrovi TaxID=1779329 RepID=A0ABT2KS84_9RHOB|nr:hypothetical protein [Alloyangia mangrovi]MCA0940591.1 hypothetical protein [Alloyangia pacifica]MCA0945938.1 hypothetical protein [Alloyangia pacifica]MCT4372681.1 hypothetical protein [Alloyangia mangrovi]
MKHEIGYSTAASARATRADLLTMVFGAFWPAEGALEALLDRVEMSRDVPQARSARGVR